MCTYVWWNWWNIKRFEERGEFFLYLPADLRFIDIFANPSLVKSSPKTRPFYDLVLSTCFSSSWKTRPPTDGCKTPSASYLLPNHTTCISEFYSSGFSDTS